MTLFEVQRKSLKAEKMSHLEINPCMIGCPISAFTFFQGSYAVCSRCISAFCFPLILLVAVKLGPLISELAGNWVLHASSVFLHIFCFLLLSFPSCVGKNILAIQETFWNPGVTLTSEHIWSEIVTFIDLCALGQNAEGSIFNSLLWKSSSCNSYRI